MKAAEACRKTSKHRTAFEKESLYAYISNLEFFKAMPPSVIHKACDQMTTEEFEMGEESNCYAVISQGDEGDCMYILLSGSASISIFKIKVVVLVADSVVGETALQSQARRSSTVVADTKLVALKLRKSDYEGVLYALKKEERYQLTFLLKTYPSFAEWNHEKVHLLANYVRCKTYQQGQGSRYPAIYEQGQPSYALHILKQGRLKLQTYVKIQTGNKWPVGSRLWEEVRVDKTVAIDFKEVLPGETFGGLEIIDSTPRTTRACAQEDSVVLSVNQTDLVAHFLKSDVDQLLAQSKFILPVTEALQAQGMTKLRKLKDHVSARQQKAIEDSITADFNYSNRTGAEDLRSALVRKWIGGYKRKSKQKNLKAMQDIINVSKSVKFLTQKGPSKRQADSKQMPDLKQTTSPSKQTALKEKADLAKKAEHQLEL
jgi:CRP-like cAMP-binding protein